MSVELVVIAPALVLLLLLVGAGGRLGRIARRDRRRGPGRRAGRVGGADSR